MLTDKEKAIALECHREHEIDGRSSDRLVYAMFDDFLSRIREEQEAVAWITDDGHLVPNSFKRYYENNTELFPIFTTPPAAPDCPRKQPDGGMSSTAVVCGDSSSSDMLIKKIQESSALYDCSELVEALKAIESIASPSSIEYLYAEKALSNHAKRMKGEE